MQHLLVSFDPPRHHRGHRLVQNPVWLLQAPAVAVGAQVLRLGLTGANSLLKTTLLALTCHTSEPLYRFRHETLAKCIKWRQAG